MNLQSDWNLVKRNKNSTPFWPDNYNLLQHFLRSPQVFLCHPPAVSVGVGSVQHPLSLSLSVTSSLSLSHFTFLSLSLPCCLWTMGEGFFDAPLFVLTFRVQQTKVKLQPCADRPVMEEGTMWPRSLTAATTTEKMNSLLACTCSAPACLWVPSFHFRVNLHCADIFFLDFRIVP